MNEDARDRRKQRRDRKFDSHVTDECVVNRSSDTTPYFAQTRHPMFPANVINHMAKILTDDYKHATVASLNVCNREYHVGTLAALWKTVFNKAPGDLGQLEASAMWERMTRTAVRNHVQ
jgi:hypothetical protein